MESNQNPSWMEKYKEVVLQEENDIPAYARYPYLIKVDKLAKIILVISLVVWAFAGFRQNRLPGKEEILDESYQSPLQKKTSEKPFSVEIKGLNYQITPLADYELHGLVVSNVNQGDFFWNIVMISNAHDYLNTKDICVIWGENISSSVYKNIRFRSDVGTCRTFPKTMEDYSHFRGDCLSNNHLLTADKHITKEILKTQTGDQIYVKGLLVAYKNPVWKTTRRSSLVRNDHWNGACEVIYVTDYKILKTFNLFWRFIYRFFGYLAIVCFFTIIIIFYVLKGRIPIENPWKG